MSKTYVILSIVLIGLAFGLILLPETNRTNEIEPEILYKEIIDPSRYLSADLVAERLINEDPSIMLVDVRSYDQYEAYSLPNAVGIPLDEILLPEWEDYFMQEDMDVVLYSNGDVFSDQAWVICTRLGYRNLYVLSGGLNQWFNDIMQPAPPPETAPSEAFDLYSFRRAACFHFGGGSIDMGTSMSDQEPIKLVKREKKVISEGGC